MPYFMALLTVFQRFTLADWGVEPSLAPPDMFMEKNEDPKLSVEFTLDPKVVVTLKHPGSSELPFRGPVLKGRATCILSATGKSEFVIKQSLVIKAYWPETRRSNEATIIQKAIDALEESNKKDLVKHLPKLIAWKDIDSSNTLNIMSELGKSYDPKTDPARILRLLLFRRLEPLESITKEDEFTKAWLQCFTCHYHLWVKGIQHGDISVWNLMRDPVESCGVLNDFDLSVIKGGSSENRGGERTGTLPFMARKLLNIGFLSGNEERKYMYELESFVWVFAWLCLRGESDIPDPGMDWRQRDLRNAAGAKQLFLLEYAQVTPESCYRYAWGKCGKLIQLLRDIDENQALRDRLRLTGEINSHSVYSEVFKIIETEYTIADWLNFKSRIMSDALQEAENL
ncbi:hypothetical protein BDQ17DRAFT_1285839 [Cyathus striatus]|nr:hypothetical protein BDQ17DRAFT_1285839 [Cyathus striatus]